MGKMKGLFPYHLLGIILLISFFSLLDFSFLACPADGLEEPVSTSVEDSVLSPTPSQEAEFSKRLEELNFSKQAIVIAFAATPIFELRGSIPWAIHYYKMPWQKAYLLSIIGNLLPVPFIILILRYGVQLLMKIPIAKKFFDWLFARTRKRGTVIEKYKSVGLILLVMIPLPVTGAWTGSVAAYLFGIKFFPALLCIFIGICLAGVIVTVLSLFGIWGAIIAGVALATLLVLWLIRVIRRYRFLQHSKESVTSGHERV
jgi:uncharacterized membrane protein